MLSADFEYVKPDSLEDAVEILLKNRNSRILAGGTDLIVKIRGGSLNPGLVVDIKGIDSLNRIDWSEGYISIGAGVTWNRIKYDRLVNEHFPALIHASQSFGCYEVANRATLGGNLANGAPGAEGGCPCAVYGAEIEIFGPDGRRIVPLNQFLLGPGHTALKDGEILISVRMPAGSPGSKSAYRRASRVRGQDLATCGIAVMVLNPDGITDRKVRVALSAVAKTPYRPPELEDMLSGRVIDEEVMGKVRAWLMGNLYPRASSLRGSPDYKKRVLGALLEDILSDFGMIRNG